MLNLILTEIPWPKLCSLAMAARAWSSSIWAALSEGGKKHEGNLMETKTNQLEQHASTEQNHDTTEPC